MVLSGPELKQLLRVPTLSINTNRPTSHSVHVVETDVKHAVKLTSDILSKQLETVFKGNKI